jgi:hypothetical protein
MPMKQEVAAVSKKKRVVVDSDIDEGPVPPLPARDSDLNGDSTHSNAKEALELTNQVFIADGMYNKNRSPDTLQDYQRPTDSTANNEERLKPSKLYRKETITPMKATAVIKPIPYSDGSRNKEQ